MTEKRFKVTNISENGNTGLFWLGKDNLSVYDVVRVLNELYDENKELQGRINRQYQEYKKLEKENNELKYHLNETEKELKEYKDFMSLG